MEHSENIGSGPGSIADTAARLINWSKRGSWGLARVEYISEFARERVLNDLHYALSETSAPFAQIELPPNQSASEVVRYLIERLQGVGSGVVSVTGFATAFSTDASLEDSLRVLNFNRENIALPGIRQIWWMPSNFAEVFVSAVPDLDSWFTVRLHLTEVIPLPGTGARPSLQRPGGHGGPGIPPRNRFFTGRDDVLDAIRATLSSKRAVCLTGVGGVGKTQTAIEYAHRHWHEYQAVLWATADSEATLTSGLAEIAVVMGFEGARELDQTRAVEAVRHWLTTSGDWLLVLDEAAEPDVLLHFLTNLSAKGHVLLTSRRHGLLARLGAGVDIELGEMSADEAVEFLYRRAGRKEITPSDKSVAHGVVRALGCLPLALEMAGAYIRETQVNCQDYLARLEERLAAPPAGPRWGREDDGLERLSAAFDINLSVPAEFSEHSVDLLRIGSFLHPDKIPVELFMWLDPAIQEFGEDLSSWDEHQLAVYRLLYVLARNSLVQIDGASETFGVHRVVQALTRDGIDKGEQRAWVEKTIRAVSYMFRLIGAADRAAGERLLPHALACAGHIKNWGIYSEESVRLLTEVGAYLRERGRYAEAEPVLRQALDAASKYRHVPPAVEMSALMNLALVCYAQGRYAEATQLYQRAIALQEEAYGREDPRLAASLNTMAQMSLAAKDYENAESLLGRALDIERATLGEKHPALAKTLNSLGRLHLRAGRYEEAKTYFGEALRAASAGSDEDGSLILGIALGMASAYMGGENYEQAKGIYEQILELVDPKEWAGNTLTREAIRNLAIIYANEKSYEKAEALLRHEFEMEREALGEDHPATAQTLGYLAMLWHLMGRDTQAEQAVRNALWTQEKVLGASHPALAGTLKLYADILRDLHREEEAGELEHRAMRLAR